MGMTVYKYLTGHDGPLLNIEWALQSQYSKAQHYFSQQKGKKK